MKFIAALCAIILTVIPAHAATLNAYAKYDFVSDFYIVFDDAAEQPYEIGDIVEFGGVEITLLKCRWFRGCSLKDYEFDTVKYLPDVEDLIADETHGYWWKFLDKDTHKAVWYPAKKWHYSMEHVAPVPLPAALLFFLTGLSGLFVWRRKQLTSDT